MAEGALDEHALVRALIPELKSSAFGDATVRQVLDITTALKFSEDYADPKAEVWAHAQAGSPLPPPAGYTGPRSYHESLQQINKSGAHGQAFGYKTPNSDALGWLLARATGKPLGELLAERIWRRIGAEREAFYTVDTIGTPFAGGGLGYGNWELSADRANASRRELMAGGLPEDRMLRVQGLAASLLFEPKDPLAASNRRISIIVMNREAEDRIFRTGAEALAEQEQAASEGSGTGWLPGLPTK